MNGGVEGGRENDEPQFRRKTLLVITVIPDMTEGHRAGPPCPRPSQDTAVKTQSQAKGPAGSQASLPCAVSCREHPLCEALSGPREGAPVMRHSAGSAPPVSLDSPKRICGELSASPYPRSPRGSLTHGLGTPFNGLDLRLTCNPGAKTSLSGSSCGRF